MLRKAVLALSFVVSLVSSGALPAADAERAARVFRIGTLDQGSPRPPGQFALTLRDLGYVEGRNVIFDRRFAEGDNERFPRLAAAVVALKPDVILADSTPAAIAAKRVTTAIPIVIVNVSDPVGTGLVASLARPGGNVTGVTDFGADLAVKYVDLLHNLVPRASRIAVLMSDNPVHPLQLKSIQAAAEGIGLTVVPAMIKTEADFEAAYASMAGQKAGALIWLGGAPVSTTAQQDKIIALSAKSQLPTLFPDRDAVERGGLLSYAPSGEQLAATAAIYVDKILKGAKPGDLPIEQPTKVELVINLKTAKALGLSIPPSLLRRADAVIR
jgi:putative ABC transport system substrate-binding protein